jgi:hypothetical protein
MNSFANRRLTLPYRKSYDNKFVDCARTHVKGETFGARYEAAYRHEEFICFQNGGQRDAPLGEPLTTVGGDDAIGKYPRVQSYWPVSPSSSAN